MNLNDTVINVQNISKIYRLGTKDEMHENIVYTAVDFIKSPLKNFRKYRSLYNFDDIQLNSDGKVDNMPTDVLCAVNNVSFTVNRGEVLGIIGGNGAGKSTLLKILSRITSPTIGRIELKGKISSLLEVGTGFHPELTGIENIYLNGVILGMRKKEVTRKLDQIIDFSGVEKFLDTPVKRYSSGMKVRLAFSVAAHLDPEILIIDEVLAVGDAEFQKKCLGRMDKVAKGGKTVLFVSHDMRAIAKLCSRVLLLENGCIDRSGAPLDIIETYLSSKNASKLKWIGRETERNDTEVKLLSATVLSSDFKPVELVNYNSGFNVAIKYDVRKATKDLVVYLQVSDAVGNDLWTSWDTDSSDWDADIRSPGVYTSICKVPPFIMRPGRYNIKIGAMIPGEKLIERHSNAIVLDRPTRSPR